MKLLINDIDSVFKDINNYFNVQESSDVYDHYFNIQTKMKNTLHSMKDLIDESQIVESTKAATKIINNFFIIASTLMDLSFKLFKIYYKIDKNNKYETFYTTFKSLMNSKEEHILNLCWYHEIPKIRNLKIHENENVQTFIKDKTIFFQFFNEIEYPIIISDFFDHNFFVDFTLYAIDKLNVFTNFLDLLFNHILKDKAKFSKTELENLSSHTSLYNLTTASENNYDSLYSKILKIKNSIKPELKHHIDYFSMFQFKDKVLHELIEMIESGQLNYLSSYYASDVYFHLANLKFQNNLYTEGITLLWKGYKINNNTMFVSNLLYGYINSTIKLDTNLVLKLDMLIESNIVEAWHNHNLKFLSNVSSYYILTDRFKEALEVAEIGVNMSPVIYDVDLCYNYGYLLRKNRNINKAKNVFLKVIELNPRDYNAYTHLIDCSYISKDYSLLINSLVTALKLFSNTDELSSWAEFLLKSNVDNEVLQPLIEYYREKTRD